WAGNVSWRKGVHNLRAGVDIEHYRTDGFSNLYFGPFGTQVFGPGATLGSDLNPSLYSASNLFPNAFAGFLVGAPSATGTTNFLVTPTARKTWSSAWAGDSLTLAKIVNVDLGVRYEIYSPIRPRHAGGAIRFFPSTNTIGPIGPDNTNVPKWDYN